MGAEDATPRAPLRELVSSTRHLVEAVRVRSSIDPTPLGVRPNTGSGSPPLNRPGFPGVSGEPGAVQSAGISTSKVVGASFSVCSGLGGRLLGRFWERGPQRPGPRIPIPAAFKYALAVSR